MIEAPTIELAPPGEFSRRRRGAAAHVDDYDWVVFTSQNGVSFTKQRLLEIGLDARAFGGAKIAAIGDATRRRRAR